jgi:multidrug efflux pump
VALGTLVLTAVLYIVIPKGLFPTQDTGQLQARLETGKAVSYAKMADLQQQAAKVILEDPDVNNLSSVVGVDAANNTMLHTGSMLINLKHKRTSSQQETMDRLRARVAEIPGLTLYLQPTQDLTIDAETGPTQFRVSIEGADNATVNEWATKLAAQMRTKQQVRNVVSDVGASANAAYVSVDRDTASRLSVTAAAIDDALYSAFGQRIVSTIFTETNQYRVILEARRDDITTPADLGNLQLKTGSGKATPLSAVATVTNARRRCRSRTWRSTRPPRWASTPRRACRWAPPWTASAKPPPRSRCRPR